MVRLLGRKMSLDGGQVVTYVGGLGVGVVAQSSQAQEIPTTISLMQVPVPLIEVTLGDCVALGGFVVVLLRFAWDLWKWRNKHG